MELQVQRSFGLGGDGAPVRSHAQGGRSGRGGQCGAGRTSGRDLRTVPHSHAQLHRLTPKPAGGAPQRLSPSPVQKGGQGNCSNSNRTHSEQPRKLREPILHLQISHQGASHDVIHDVTTVLLLTIKLTSNSCTFTHSAGRLKFARRHSGLPKILF